MTTPTPATGLFSWWHETAEIRVIFAGRGGPPDRESALRKLVPPNVDVAWLSQIHSARVVAAQPGHCGQADALIAERSALALAVVTADCVPILLATSSRVAAIHAGWRGLVAGIILNTIDRLEEVPQQAWIGPAISQANYEVGPEVSDAVVAVSSIEVVTVGPGGRPQVDLSMAAELQLRRAGVESIRRLRLCTFGSPSALWSYRRDGDRAGRNLALIMRKP